MMHDMHDTQNTPRFHLQLQLRARLSLNPRPLLVLLAFFCTMVIVGSIPGEASALSDRFGDKLLHALAYGFMSVLAYRAVRGPRVARALVCVVFITLLGLLDESIQYFLPYRNASLLDWCFDIGAALVMSLVLCLRRQASSEPN